MKKVFLTSAILAASLFAASTSNSASNSYMSSSAVSSDEYSDSCIIKNGYKKDCIISIEASGVGVSPCTSCHAAQSMAMARRAAIIEAYKALAEKMYGIKINGRDTVKNMMLQNSRVRAYVYGLIRGANIEEEEYKNGMYKVVMSVKLDAKAWNKFILNASN